MTSSEIKNYFTINYGLGYKPKFKAICFGKGLIKILSFLILSPFTIIKAIVHAVKVKKFKKEYIRRGITYRGEYQKIIDALTSDKDGAIKKRALEKLGLDEEEVKEIKPILFWGWDYTNEHSQPLYWEDLGNGKWHANKIEITYIFMTQKQVAVYVLRRDLQNNKDNEDEREIYYRQVAGIRTKTKTITDAKTASGKVISRENVSVAIEVSGADNLEVSVNTTGHDIEASVKAMRSVIREFNENQNRGY